MNIGYGIQVLWSLFNFWWFIQVNDPCIKLNFQAQKSGISDFVPLCTEQLNLGEFCPFSRSSKAAGESRQHQTSGSSRNSHKDPISKPHAEYSVKFSGIYSGGFTSEGQKADERRLASFLMFSLWLRVKGFRRHGSQPWLIMHWVCKIAPDSKCSFVVRQCWGLWESLPRAGSVCRSLSRNQSNWVDKKQENEWSHCRMTSLE